MADPQDIFANALRLEDSLEKPKKPVTRPPLPAPAASPFANALTPEREYENLTPAQKVGQAEVYGRQLDTYNNLKKLAEVKHKGNPQGLEDELELIQLSMYLGQQMTVDPEVVYRGWNSLGENPYATQYFEAKELPKTYFGYMKEDVERAVKQYRALNIATGLFASPYREGKYDQLLEVLQSIPEDTKPKMRKLGQGGMWDWIGSIPQAIISQAPYLADMGFAGILGSAVGGGIGLLAGPEAVPAAAAAGRQVATFLAGSRLGAASIFMDAMTMTDPESGLPLFKAVKDPRELENIARWSSAVWGGVEGAIGMLQFESLIGKGILKKAATDVLKKGTVRSLLAESAKKYGKNVLFQTGTEPVQEIMELIGQDIVAAATNESQGTNVPRATAQDFARLAATTADVTFRSSLLFTLPGSVVEAKASVAEKIAAWDHANAEKRIQNINHLTDAARPFAERAVDIDARLEELRKSQTDLEQRISAMADKTFDEKSVRAHSVNQAEIEYLEWSKREESAKDPEANPYMNSRDEWAAKEAARKAAEAPPLPAAPQRPEASPAVLREGQEQGIPYTRTPETGDRSFEQFMGLKPEQITPEIERQMDDYLLLNRGKERIPTATELGSRQNIIFTGGLAGGGKSSVLKMAQVSKQFVADVNSDNYRELTGIIDPEWQKTAGSLADRFYERAWSEGYHVLVDSQLTSFGSTEAQLKRALEAGGDAVFVLTNIDADTSRARVESRRMQAEAKGEVGRKVPAAATAKGHNRFLPTFIEFWKRYKDNPNVHFYLGDNNTDFVDSKPIIINNEVVDQKALDEILATRYVEIEEGGEKKYERAEDTRITAADLEGGERTAAARDRATRIVDYFRQQETLGSRREGGPGARAGTQELTAFSSPDLSAGSPTVLKIRYGLPNLTVEQAQGAALYAKLIAAHKGQTLDDYINETFIRGIFSKEKQKEIEARGARGAIDWTETGKAIFYTTTHSDFGTWVHELTHLFEYDLDEKERAAVYSWLGATGSLSTDQRERFAYSVVDYIRKGKIPSEDLRPAFDRMARWLNQIYHADLDWKISPEIEQMYNEALAGQLRQPGTHGTDNSVMVFEVRPGTTPRAKDAAYHSATAEMTDSIQSGDYDAQDIAAKVRRLAAEYGITNGETLEDVSDNFQGGDEDRALGPQNPETREFLDEMSNVYALFPEGDEQATTDTIQKPSQNDPSTLKPEDFLLLSEHDQAIRDVYIDPETHQAREGVSSRTTPMPPMTLTVGQWMIDDGCKGSHGREIAQLRQLDPNTLEVSEHLVEENIQNRGEDAKRYATWMKIGLTPPPIRVVETDAGNLKVVDGHRRTAAAIQAGQPILAWVWPAMDHPDPEAVEYYTKKRLRVGMTYEQMTGQAWPGDVKPVSVEETRRQMSYETRPGDKDPWILKSREIVRQKMRGPQPASAIRAMLEAGGVKAEEMEWLGLNDYLKGNTKLKPEEVLNFIEANAITIKETVHQAIPQEVVDQQIEETRKLEVERIITYLEERHEPPDIASTMDITEFTDEETGEPIVEVTDLNGNKEQFDTREEAEAYIARAQEDADVEYMTVIRDQAEDKVASNMARKDAQERIEREARETLRLHGYAEPRFGEYTISPKGENYKELLLQMPERITPVEDPVLIPENNGVPKADGTLTYYVEHKGEPMGFVIDRGAKRAFAIPRFRIHIDAHYMEMESETLESAQARINDLLAMKKDAFGFTGGHWNEKNVFAHIRFSDQVDADGKRSLHLEEIQSDLHQKARKLRREVVIEVAGKKKISLEEAEKLVPPDVGYSGAVKPKLPPDFVVRKMTQEDVDAEGSGFVGAWGLFDDGDNMIDFLATTEVTHEQAAQQFAENATAIGVQLEDFGGRSEGIPNVPFKKTWPELAFRRALRWAVENGYDEVTWSTGQQEADLYDLSKQVDAIVVMKGTEGKYEWWAKKAGQVAISNRVVQNLAELEDEIGKDLAVKAETQSEEEWVVYGGLDLRIGSEGMVGFYDKQLVNIAKKIAKKYGAKVDMVQIGHAVDESKIREALKEVIESEATEGTADDEGPQAAAARILGGMQNGSTYSEALASEREYFGDADADAVDTSDAIIEAKAGAEGIGPSLFLDELGTMLGNATSNVEKVAIEYLIYSMQERGRTYDEALEAARRDVAIGIYNTSMGRVLTEIDNSPGIRNAKAEYSAGHNVMVHRMEVPDAMKADVREGQMLFEPGPHEESVRQAVENGLPVPDRVLEEYIDREWAQTEANRRTQLAEAARTFPNFEDFLDWQARSSAEGFPNRSYYENIWNRSQRTDPAPAIQSRSFREAIQDDETIHYIVGGFAMVHEEDLAAQGIISAEMKELGRRLVQNEQPDDALTQKVRAQLEDDPTRWIRFFDKYLPDDVKADLRTTMAASQEEFVPVLPKVANERFTRDLQREGKLEDFLQTVGPYRLEGKSKLLSNLAQRLRDEADFSLDATARYRAMKEIRKSITTYREVLASATNDEDMLRQLYAEADIAVETEEARLKTENQRLRAEMKKAQAIVHQVTLKQLWTMKDLEREQKERAELKTRYDQDIADAKARLKLSVQEARQSVANKALIQDVIKTTLWKKRMAEIRKRNEADLAVLKARVKQVKDLGRQRLQAEKDKARVRFYAEYINRPVNAGIADEYARRIEDIQARIAYDPEDVPDTLKNKLREWRRRNPQAPMPSDLVQKIEASNPRLITAGEMAKLYDEVKALRTAGRKMRMGALLAERTFVQNEIKTVSKSIQGKRAPRDLQGYGTKGTIRATKTPTAKTAIWATWRMNRIAEMLDGGRPGPVTNWLWDEVNDKTDEVIRVVDAYSTENQKRLAELQIRARDLGKQETIDGLKITHGQMIGVYVYSQFEDGLFSLKEDNRIPEATISKIIKALSNEEKEYGDWMIDRLSTDEDFDRLQQVQLDVSNTRMDRLRRYFPMQRQGLSGNPLLSELAKELLDMAGKTNKPRPRAGFLRSRMERTEGVQFPPLRLDAPAIYMDHIQKREFYIANALLIKRLNRIFDSKEVKAVMNDRHGDAMVPLVQKYIAQYATPNIYRAFEDYGEFARILRGNVGMSLIGSNLVTMMKQLPDIPQIMLMAGPVDGIRAAAQFLANPRATLQQMWEKAPQLKQRSYDRFIEELKTFDRNTYERVVRTVGEAGFAVLKAMDTATNVIGWTAVYNKTMRRTGNENLAKKAARNFILRKRPAARAKDVAAIYRSPGLSWFLMFSNQQNQQWNILTYDIPQGIKEGLRGNGGAMIDAVLNVTGLLVGAVGMGLVARKGRMEASDLLEDFLNMLFGNTPFIGNAIESAIRGQPAQDALNPFAGAYQLGKIGYDVANQADTEKVMRDLQNALFTLAGTAGFPVVQARRIYRTIESGDPWDLIGGPPKKEK